MAELVVSRWRKYGKDRLYVSAHDGTKVGWVDVPTGAVTVQATALARELQVAIATHCATTGLRLPIQPAQPGQSPKPVPVQSVESVHRELEAVDATASVVRDKASASHPESDPNAQDLAANRPGQGVRELAEAERAAMWERNSLLAVAARVLDTNTQERRWRVGADGEEAIGSRLNKLAKHGWHILHSVPVGQRGADIDHVLIGPGGVFTINTKRHPNKSVVAQGDMIRVDGHRQPYVPKSRFEARRAARLLSQACGFPDLVARIEAAH